MSHDRHRGWYETIRRHWRKTRGYLLASSQPCIDIRDRELHAVKGRSLASRDPQNVARWTPPESWILAVILCPGDDVRPIVEWVRAHDADPDRVWFYLRPTTPTEVLTPWVEAGQRPDQVATVSS